MLRSCACAALMLCSAATAAQAARTDAVGGERIPLVRGLTITTAIAEPAGDYESRKTLVERTDDGWRLGYSASIPGAGGQPESLASERLLHDADLVSARTYRNHFESGVEEDYPGTTALGVSSEVLLALRTAGSSGRFALVGESRWLVKALGASGGDDALAIVSALTRNPNVSFRGELGRRPGTTVDVLVNGRTRALPALIGAGRFTARDGRAMDAELAILDDDANPIALYWRIGSGELRVVRIDYPEPRADLADTLRQQRRVTLPGLFFDFASSTLRPESRAALPRILDAIHATPGQLLLEGHTDSIGEAGTNLALSKARAEAVRTALIALDAGIAGRLDVDGAGETRPQASNDSLQGRAQNRRVELALR
jgi:OOP family OmpA-OmpF porin